MQRRRARREAPASARRAVWASVAALAAVCFSGCLADDAGRVAVRGADDAARGAGDLAPGPGSLPRLPKPSFDEAVTPTLDSLERTEAPADVLHRMIAGHEREWVCRTIDLGIAVQDGRLSFDEFAAGAAQEAAGRAPQWRQRKAQAAIEQLLAGEPSALRELACL